MVSCLNKLHMYKTFQRLLAQILMTSALIYTVGTPGSKAGLRNREDGIGFRTCSSWLSDLALQGTPPSSKLPHQH